MNPSRRLLTVAALILLLSSSASAADFQIESIDGEDPNQVNTFSLAEGEEVPIEFSGLNSDRISLYVEINGERLRMEDGVIKAAPYDFEPGEHTLTAIQENPDRDNRKEVDETRVEVTAVGRQDSDSSDSRAWRVGMAAVSAVPPEPHPSHDIRLNVEFNEPAEATFTIDPFGKDGLPDGINLDGAAAEGEWPTEATLKGDTIEVTVDGTDGPDKGEITITVELDASDVYEEGMTPEHGTRYALQGEGQLSGKVPVNLWNEILYVAVETPDGERVVPETTGRDYSKMRRGIPADEWEPSVWVGNVERTDTGTTSPDENGVWQIGYQPGQDEILGANVEGYVFEPVLLEDIDSEKYTRDDPYVIEMTRGAGLEIVLEDEEGNRIPNGFAEINRVDGPEHLQATQEIDAGDEDVVERRLPNGQYRGWVAAPTTLPSDQLDFELTEGETTTRTVTLKTPEVTSSNIEHIGGTEPDVESMKVDSIYYQGAILISVKPQNSPEITREDVTKSGVDKDVYGLSDVGADQSTELRLTLEMEEFEPDTLMWAARDADWEVTEKDGDTATVDVEVRPTEIQQIDEMRTGFGSAEKTDWPTGGEDTADKGYDAVVDFWLFDTSELPGEASDTLGGMSITTNSQIFGFPQVEGGELSIYMAAPGTTADGEDFTGFYQAYIPDPVLNNWNIDDPASDLEVMWKGDSEQFGVEEVEDGVYIEIDPVEFSDGNMTMRSTTYKPPLLERVPFGTVIQQGIRMVANLF